MRHSPNWNRKYKAHFLDILLWYFYLSEFGGFWCGILEICQHTVSALLENCFIESMDATRESVRGGGIFTNFWPQRLRRWCRKARIK